MPLRPLQAFAAYSGNGGALGSWKLKSKAFIHHLLSILMTCVDMCREGEGLRLGILPFYTWPGQQNVMKRWTSISWGRCAKGARGTEEARSGSDSLCLPPVAPGAPERTLKIIKTRRKPNMAVWGCKFLTPKINCLVVSLDLSSKTVHFGGGGLQLWGCTTSGRSKKFGFGHGNMAIFVWQFGIALESIKLEVWSWDVMGIPYVPPLSSIQDDSSLIFPESAGGASWRSWAMPWDHRSCNPRRSRENAGYGGFGPGGSGEYLRQMFKTYLWHFSKEHYLERLFERAKKRNTLQHTHTHTLSLSLSLSCKYAIFACLFVCLCVCAFVFVCVCARARCIAISLQVHLCYWDAAAYIYGCTRWLELRWSPWDVGIAGEWETDQMCGLRLGSRAIDHF